MGPVEVHPAELVEGVFIFENNIRLDGGIFGWGRRILIIFNEFVDVQVITAEDLHSLEVIEVIKSKRNIFHHSWQGHRHVNSRFIVWVTVLRDCLRN